MRILKLQFENINSLRGKFEVDFTDPALSERGIFAILGTTGSGKTTILDAITLALYGKTPRLEISGTANELMTRGTGFCWSEVLFEATVNGRALEFRSAWDQARAHRKAGRNLQGPGMHLYQVSPKQPGDDWEAQGVRVVPKKVAEITGLDFERFNRTCLLAQGQFAAFLDAAPDDRAAILEQITGTAIYCQLSKAAHENHKETTDRIKAMKNELQGVEIITPDQFAAQEQKVGALLADLEAGEKERRTIRQHIDWLNNLNGLHQRREQQVTAQQGLAAERLAHAEDLQRLAAGRRAETAREALTQRDGLAGQRRETEARLQAARDQLPQAQARVAAARAGLVQAEEALASFQGKAEGERRLIREARGKDQQITGLAEQEAAALQARDALAGQATDLEKALAALTRDIAGLEARRDALAQEMAKAPLDGNLGADLKRFGDLDGHLQANLAKEGEAAKQVAVHRQAVLEADKAQAAADLAFRKAEKKLQAREAEREGAKASLEMAFPGVTLAALQRALVTTEKQRAAAENLVEAGAAWRDLAAEERQTKTQVERRTREIEAAGKALEQLEAQRGQIEERITAITEEMALSKEIKDLEERRAELEEGKPCPLCGSLEHPFVAGKGLPQADAGSNEARLKKEKASLKKADAALKKARDTVSQLTSEQAADERSLATQARSRTTLTRKWEKVSRVFTACPAPEEEKKLAALAKAVGKAAEKAQEELAAFQTARTALEAVEVGVQEARTALQACRNALTAAQGELNQARALEKTAVQHQADLAAQTAVLQSRLVGEVLTYGLSDYGAETLEILRKRWAAWQKRQKELEETSRKEQKARGELEVGTAKKDGLGSQLEEQKGKVGQAQAALAAARAERTALFGDRIPDVEERRLETALADLQKKEGTARAAAHEAEVRAKGLQSTVETLSESMADLGRKLEQAGNALAAAIAAAGFAGEADLQAALLAVPEFQRLADLEKGFDTRATQLAAGIAMLDRQIQEKEAARPTTRSPGELAQEEARLAEAGAGRRQAWEAELQILTRFKADRQKNQELQERILQAEKDGFPWSLLDKLIGHSEGAKFQKFAQGLTFARLVDQANVQLKKLTDRYSLANDGLELQIVDHYIANLRASARNLSGGEKFLASLALALGLASMVGRKYRVDTLFIDEGFGALDPEALETAIAVLCSLQQQGKLIGVISHVKALEARLPVRIEVQRLGAGFSTISGPGCSHQR
ncbi:MAG: AAA family ATPase [Candidatus Riflebacteria bacterium]|nr:AAA family ATPase [Candidatus Riflebacteria bacterium]